MITNDDSVAITTKHQLYYTHNKTKQYQKQNNDNANNRMFWKIPT